MVHYDGPFTRVWFGYLGDNSLFLKEAMENARMKCNIQHLIQEPSSDC